MIIKIEPTPDEILAYATKTVKSQSIHPTKPPTESALVHLPQCRFRSRGRGGKCGWDNPPFPATGNNCRKILNAGKCPDKDTLKWYNEFVYIHDKIKSDPFVEPPPTPCATQEIADKLSAQGFKVRVINDQEKKELKGIL